MDPKFKEIGFNLSNYETFAEEAMEQKKRVKGEGLIHMREECSGIIKQKVVEVPIKMKDPRNYTFLCNVGNEHFEKSMYDLGSGISLLHMCVAISCGIQRELIPMNISIQLAEKFVVKPKEIIEDVLVRVDKFIIPLDFIVMDMEQDKNICLIFRRLLQRVMFLLE